MKMFWMIIFIVMSMGGLLLLIAAEKTESAVIVGSIMAWQIVVAELTNGQ